MAGIRVEPIRVNTSFEESYRQILFIDNFIVRAANRRNAKRAAAFAALSAVIIMLFFVTANDSIVVSFFLLPFFWICFGLYLLYIKYVTRKRQKHILKDFVAEAIDQSKVVTVSFDDTEIQIIQPEQVTIAKWAEFKAYLEEENTIYLFQGHPYFAWSFSDKEIGAAAVTRLKALAQSKLPLLQEGLWTIK